MYKHKRKVEENVERIETYERFYRVDFLNAREAPPQVTYSVETIRNDVADSEMKELTFGLSPTDTFPVINNNGEVIRQMTVLQLWQGLKSLYYYLDPDTE